MHWYLILKLTVKTELLQQSRSRKFWLMMALAGVLSWLFFPPTDSSYQVMLIDGQYRGPYNSAWYGMMLAMLSLWWSLLGFYFLRGSIRQDIESKVWELLASSQMSRIGYLLAKWCSQLLIYLAVFLLQLLLAMVLQQLWAEDRHIDVVELIKPMLLISIPSVALTSACVLWFDLIPKLRHTTGNVLFFVLWLAIMLASILPSAIDGVISKHSIGFDPRGMLMMQRAIAPSFAQLEAPLALAQAQTTVDAQQPKNTATAAQDSWIKQRSVLLLGSSTKGENALAIEVFHYPRWHQSYLDYLNAATWFGIALILVFFAALLPDRVGQTLMQPVLHSTRHTGRWSQVLLRLAGTQSLVYLWFQEVSQVFRQRSWWWWGLLGASALAQLLLAPSMACSLILLYWLPLLGSLSTMAYTEQQYRTDQYMMIAPNALWRLACCRMLTAISILLLALSPLLLRFALTAPTQLLMIVSGTVFVAAVALALGIWARQSRLFELLFMSLTYLALVQQSPIFQYQPSTALNAEIYTTFDSVQNAAQSTMQSTMHGTMQSTMQSALQMPLQNSAQLVLALLAFVIFLVGWRYRNQQPQRF